MEELKIGENSIVTVRWNTKSIDYSQEVEKNIRQKIATKYNIPVSKVKVEPVFASNTKTNTNESASADTIKSIREPQFQHQLFWTFLEDSDVTDYDKDLILSIDNQINSRINYDEYYQAKKYDIKYVKWDNFLSYGSGNSFDFSNLNGLILLNGEPANQSGKSTFAYDLIHYALFGKTSSDKAKVMADYFNYNLPEVTEMKVEICLEIDNVTYLIRRKLTRPDITKKNRNKVTQLVEWYRIENGEEISLDDAENLNGANAIQTNKAIKDAIGNEKDFDLVICANSDNLKDLISLKDTERGRLLNRWTGLDILEAKDAIARETFNSKIKPSLKSYVYNREDLKKQIEELTESNANSSDIISQKEALILSANQELSELESRKEKLFTSLKNVDPALVDVDVTTVETTLEQIKNCGARKRNEQSGIKTRLEEIGEVIFDENEYREAISTKERVSNHIVTLKNDIKHLKDNNIELTNGEYCPTCKRKLENVDNSAIIEANNAKIAEFIQDGIKSKAELDKLTETISILDAKRALKIEKDKLEISYSAKTAEITALLSDYKTNTRLISDCIANKEAIEYNNRVNADIAVLKESMKSYEVVKDNALQDIASHKSNIRHNEVAIREKEALIETIINEEKLFRHWQIYLQMIGKNGISKMVLRQTLPIINASVSQLLEGVCDFTVEIIIDDNNDVAFNLCRNGVKKHLGSGSGFEQTVSALALRVALGNMSTLSKPPFVLLDEVFGGVAKENYPNIEKLLNRIKGFYRYMFIITHEMDVKGWADHTITVRKDENGISSIFEK